MSSDSHDSTAPANLQLTGDGEADKVRIPVSQTSPADSDGYEAPIATTAADHNDWCEASVGDAWTSVVLYSSGQSSGFTRDCPPSDNVTTPGNDAPISTGSTGATARIEEDDKNDGYLAPVSTADQYLELCEGEAATSANDVGTTAQEGPSVDVALPEQYYNTAVEQINTEQNTEEEAYEEIPEYTYIDAKPPLPRRDIKKPPGLSTWNTRTVCIVCVLVFGFGGIIVAIVTVVPALNKGEFDRLILLLKMTLTGLFS